MKLSSLPTLILFAAASLGCSHSSGHAVSTSNPAITEIEPNNNAFQPDSIGPVASNTYYQIVGSIQEGESSGDYSSTFGTDSFDGFAFYVEDTVEIEFVLHAANPFADLDLWIYDPFYDEYIARFESTSSPEYGRVTFPYLGEEFHVVVNSYSGDSNYTLELIAHPLALGFSTAVSAASTEQPDSNKDDARARAYLKTAQEPDGPLVLTTVLKVDLETGRSERLAALHESSQLRVAGTKAK